MPYILKNIDKIAREKNRDVLYLQFDREVFPEYDYESWPVRTEVLNWFETHNIRTELCGGIASEHGFDSYRGQIYIDVPYDEKNPEYVPVRDYLENPDGSMRIPGVLFCYCPLTVAMKNKHHDEPGFWEKVWDDD